MNYRMFSARLIYKKVMNLGISPLFLCLLYKLLQPVPQFFYPWYTTLWTTKLCTKIKQ